jgi:hypothetical protein
MLDGRRVKVLAARITRDPIALHGHQRSVRKALPPLWGNPPHFRRPYRT